MASLWLMLQPCGATAQSGDEEGVLLAQSTGGSFGGGSFRSRPRTSTTWRTGSGSSSYYGRTRPSFRRSSSPTGIGSSRSYGGSSYRSGPTAIGAYSADEGDDRKYYLRLLIVGLVLSGALVYLVRSRRKREREESFLHGPVPIPPGPIAAPHDAMHVDVIGLGIDWRARRELQATLRHLAETGDTASAAGLARLLEETVLALRRAELAWLYVAHEASGPISPQQAEERFRRLATQKRAAFRTELVRAADGQLERAAAPALRAHPHEGEGTVVVHLLVAAYRPLRPASADAESIRAALDDRASLSPQDLAALEVIWSPAAEDDRMSTAELEQHYPELRLIDPASIAGRTFCSYCRGPFAMELLACPHCGAPAEASRANRAPEGA
ncbi:MAG TPA: DUF1517 domain-containing protein [Sandaracinaceae bacterium]